MRDQLLMTASVPVEADSAAGLSPVANANNAARKPRVRRIDPVGEYRQRVAPEFGEDRKVHAVLVTGDPEADWGWIEPLIQALPTTTTLVMSVPTARGAQIASDWIRANKPDQRAILHVFKGAGSRDRFCRDRVVLASDPDGCHAIYTNPWGGDAQMSDLFKALGIASVRSDVFFEEGDVRVTEHAIFVGTRTFKKFWFKKAWTPEELAGQLWQLYGAKPVFFIDDPNHYHIDTWLGVNDGRTVLVPDVREGLRVAEADGADKEAFFNRYRFCEDGPWDDGEFEATDAIVISHGESLRATNACAGQFDEIAQDFANLGFDVIRYPRVMGYVSGLVHGVKREEIMALTAQVNAIDLNGTICYSASADMPFDGAAESAFRQAGFDRIVPLPTRELAEANAGIRCCTQVFAGTTPEDATNWQKVLETAKQNPALVCLGF